VLALVLLIGVLLPARAAKATSTATTIMPIALVKHVEVDFRARLEGRHELNRIFVGLVHPKQVKASIRCVDCYPGSPGTRAFVAPSRLIGLIYPVDAKFQIRITARLYIGRFVELSKPPGRPAIRRILCLQPRTLTATRCSKFETKPSPASGPTPLKPTPPAPPSEKMTATTPSVEKHAETTPGAEEPPANPELITSYDGTQGDVAPSDDPFETTEQEFQASSNTITFLGVTIANPNVPTGPSGSDTVQIRLCETAGCTGTVFASVEPHVNNYGLTGSGIGKVTVTPTSTYHLVWKAPANAHGASWLTFWHAGNRVLEGSEDAEVLVQGYDEVKGEPHPDERAVTSYDGSWLATAPYSGSFEDAHQAFKASSNTITTAGVVLGNPALPRYVQGTQTVLLRLCETPECANGALAQASTHVFNYGITEASLGTVHVSEGATYYLNWQAPEKVDGESWLAYWLGSGPTLPQATQLQAFVKGYDRSVPNSTVYHTEQEATFGANTFADPFNASEEGEPIKPETFVEVSCKVYAPQIESIDPQGYWYRIHSAPWDDRYYAAANTFWNGVLPTDAFEPVFTDYAVPTCPA
jgi:hypothetical protein